MDELERKNLSNGFFDAIQNLIHDNVFGSGLDLEDPEVLSCILKSLGDVEAYFESLIKPTGLLAPD